MGMDEMGEMDGHEWVTGLPLDVPGARSPALLALALALA